MNNDEVDHVPESRAVGQIAYDASQQKGARSKHAIVVARRANEVIENRQRCSNRQHNEKPATERSTFLQLTEGNAGIFRIDEVEKSSNNLLVFAIPERTHGPGF